MHYLSDEWIVAASSALANAVTAAPAGRVVVDQHIDGVVSYRVTIEHNTGSLTPLGTTPPGQASTPGADASFHQSIETARAVAAGTTDAHQAFLLGHIRFDGNIDVLIEHRDAFAWMQAALAPVMAATTFG